jgi:hypothetical protein
MPLVKLNVWKCNKLRNVLAELLRVRAGSIRLVLTFVRAVEEAG